VPSVLLRNSLRFGVAAFITAALALLFERIAYVWYPMLAVGVLVTITGALVTFLVHTVLAGWQGVLMSLLALAQEQKPLMASLRSLSLVARC
jgi:hypothetical protein